MRLVHPQGIVLCRGLIHQAHNFEYINKLTGFNYSYICIWFVLCMCLIYL